MPDIRLSSSGVGALSDRLGQVPPRLRNAVRERLRRLGQRIAQDARGRAGKFSRRIPPAVGVRASVRGGATGGFEITLAPTPTHARLYESGGARSVSAFFPPLFGNTRRRYRREVRPFVRPAFQDNAFALTLEMQRAVEDATDGL